LPRDDKLPSFEKTGEMARAKPTGDLHSTLHAEVIEDAGEWSVFATFDEIQKIVNRSIVAVVGSQNVSGQLPSTPAGLEFAVVLSDDAAIARLNHQFRGKEGPTNVLSFPAPGQFAQTDANAPRPLGDVVLALETVLNEAAQMSRTPRDHFTHLIVHGLLHLIGYDHINEVDAEEMEMLETEILATLGISDPYAGADSPGFGLDQTPRET